MYIFEVSYELNNGTRQLRSVFAKDAIEAITSTRRWVGRNYSWKTIRITSVIEEKKVDIFFATPEKKKAKKKKK